MKLYKIQFMVLIEQIKRLTVAIEIAKSQKQVRNCCIGSITEQEEKEKEKDVKETPAEEDDSDDDIGPMPMKPKEEEKEEPSPKEAYELSDLPCAAMYEKSYTHPSHLLLTCVTPKTDFIYTASINGSVKIWKKFPTVFYPCMR